MKKLSILMTGALLAVLILQGCSKDSETSAPTKDQTTVQPPQGNVNPTGSDAIIPLGIIPLVTGAGTTPVVQSALDVGSVQPMIDTNGDGIRDTVYRAPDASWGISAGDVTVVGQGIVTASGNACPVTGACACTLVGAAVNCRGDNVAGNTNAIIRITNNTAAGGMGTCAMYPNSICKNDTDCYPNMTGAALAFECVINPATYGITVPTSGADLIMGTADDPNPGANCTNPAVPGNPGAAATANAAACMPGTICTVVNVVARTRFCLGQKITDNANGNAVGYCLNGFTTCNDNAVAGDGIATPGRVNGAVNGGAFTACGAGTCSITVARACLVNANCPGGETCVGAAPIGAGSNAATCWTGCGPMVGGVATAAPDCVPGRNLNCVQVRYDGSQTAGTAYDVGTATTYPKCTLSPYAAVGYNNTAADAWRVGSIPLAGPGSATATLRITPYDADYCVHYFTIHELASGDQPGCAATCGDGWVAANAVPPEICEPIDDGTGTNTDLGCPAGSGLSCASCAGPCVLVGPLCGNGALDAGETCDPGIAGTVCCNPATCLFTAAGTASPQGGCPGAGACVDAVCNGLGATVVTGCTTANKANGTACGGVAAVCDTLDTCNAGVCIDNVAAAGTNCGAAPVLPCDPQDVCNGVLKTCPANLAAAGTACGGVAAVCDALDTCNGAGVCVDNVAALGTNCGAAPALPCDPQDTCNGVLKTCPVNCAAGGTVCGGGTCDGACACVPAGKTITGIVAIKGTSPGYNTGVGPGGDYNPAMTGGGAAMWYVIVPNDPAVTGHPSDRVEATVTISAALVGGDTVTCTVSPGALPMDESDCQAGDVTCRIHGVHPQVTGGGINTKIQAEGAVSGVFPDELTTATSITVSCVLNANPAVTLVGNEAMGFIGANDQVLPAAGGAFQVQLFSYCSNGATEACDSLIIPGGGIGISAQSTVLHFNPAVVTAVGAQFDPMIRANPINAYGVPTAGVCATTNQACGGCNTAGMPAGAAHWDGNCVSCAGWLMAYMGGCNLTSSAQPAQTFSFIDVTAFSADQVEYIADIDGMPIRGSDAALNPAPSTNVRGTLYFQ